jgi:hypothetical protein
MRKGLRVKNSALQVKVQNLPFAASLEYALYTHGYVMVAGYPHFRTSDESTAKMPSYHQLALSPSHPSARCPAKSSKLEISDEEILEDDHMATVFVSDAVLQCLLWGLYEQGKLSTLLKDGDIPNVCFPYSHLNAETICCLLAA